MKLRVWSKTLLSVYNSLENIALAVDKVVKATSLKRGGNCNATYNQAEQILELMQRKKGLINIKLLIEKVLASIDVVSCRILVLKFFDKIKAEDIAVLLNVSRRTVFRKINNAVQSFESGLLKNGYDIEKVEDLLKDESWIIEIFDTFYFEEQKKSHKEFLLEDLNLSPERLVSFAISNMNKLNKRAYF